MTCSHCKETTKRLLGTTIRHRSLSSPSQFQELLLIKMEHPIRWEHPIFQKTRKTMPRWKSRVKRVTLWLKPNDEGFNLFSGTFGLLQRYVEWRNCSVDRRKSSISVSGLLHFIQFGLLVLCLSTWLSHWKSLRGSGLAYSLLILK